MKRSIKTLCFSIFVLAGAWVAVADPFSGAIFTTKFDGTAVDMNIYDTREDVYLNGGPQNDHANGLPQGTYYFQVTDPSGMHLLSTDDAECRQLVVGSNGRVNGVPSEGPACLHEEGLFDNANMSKPVKLFPFDFTPNPGGEYKAWLIRQTGDTSLDPDDPKVILFKPSDSKTDNFKVLEEQPPPETFSISGRKFYDVNVNGTRDLSEVGIGGWRIELGGGPEGFVSTNTTTDLDGDFEFLSLNEGTYEACEVLPQDAPTWLPTTPTSIPGISVGPDSEDNDFGNICLGAGGGMTLGFWSNKNGKSILQAGDPAWRAALNALSLRTAIGEIYNVPGVSFDTAYTSFRTWLVGANATNMAYMLSAQLAAMRLNVLNGKVAGGSFVYAPGCGNAGLNNNFITIQDLIVAASSALQDPNGFTLSGNPARAGQECLKNALDGANNNLNFVQPAACEINYSGSETSCLPE
jgi:SdrD B-like domain